jgi:superfamily II DNA/RNA helicase
VVLDEADCLSDMGFMPDVMRILDAAPAGQRMLFSATLDHQVAQLAEQYLKTPVFHAAAEQGSTPGLMQHRVFTLAEAEKVDVAAEIAVRPARTLFFVRTKLGADRLARDLGQRGVAALAIHGNLNQSRRLRVLDAFAAGTTRVMVATDVAARGLHIDDVDLVVHYDPPHDHKDYLHRSGRTARAGAAGTVVSFVSGHQARDVARIHRQAAVSAEQVMQVTCGHPAVRALAESGEAIPVRRVAKRTGPARTGGARPRVRS